MKTINEKISGELLNIGKEDRPNYYKDKYKFGDIVQNNAGEGGKPRDYIYNASTTGFADSNHVGAYRHPFEGDSNRLDIQNSKSTKLSPEEAKVMMKEDPSLANRFILSINNKLVLLSTKNNRGNADSAISGKKSYDNVGRMDVPAGKEYIKKTGKVVSDTAGMPYYHLFDIADSIWLMDYKFIPQDLLDKRSQNPESRNYRYQDGKNLSNLHINRDLTGKAYKDSIYNANYADNKIRRINSTRDNTDFDPNGGGPQGYIKGSDYSYANYDSNHKGHVKSNAVEVPFVEPYIYSSGQLVNKKVNSLADYKDRLQKDLDDFELSVDLDNLDMYDKAKYEKHKELINNAEDNYNQAVWKLKDVKSDIKNMDSFIDLRKHPDKMLAIIRDKLRALDDAEIDDAKADNLLKHGGSNTQYARDRLRTADNQIDAYRFSLETYKDRIEKGEELKSKEIARLQGIINDTDEELAKIEARKARLKKSFV